VIGLVCFILWLSYILQNCTTLFPFNWLSSPWSQAVELMYYIYVGGSQSFWNSSTICSKKWMCVKPILVTIEVLHFCTNTLAPALLPLLEAPLEVLFMYDCETVLILCGISCTDMKQWPLSIILSLRKTRKLHPIGSGVYSGWMVVGIWIFTRKMLHCKGVWQGTL
jgi:hypothetical protein